VVTQTATISPTIIEEQLHWDTRLDAENIQVTVADGHVTLTGSVPTYFDRMIATEDVWRVQDVVSVDNQLAVKYPSHIKVPTDEDIKQYLAHILLWHPTINSNEITLHVNNGMVDLEGTVDSYWQKLTVEEMVANTFGVVNLSNRLAVVPQDDAADEETAKDIMDALHRAQAINADDIDVKVKDGRVKISGSVPHADAYRTARDIAAYTFGVIDVDNKLIIVPN